MPKRKPGDKRSQVLAYLAYIAMVDVMAGFIGVLLMTTAQMKSTVQAQVATLETRKAELAAQIEKAKEDHAQETARLVAEYDLKKEALNGQIAESEAQLAQKQQDFQDWDWLVDRLRVSEGMSRKPDAHLYLRSRGIYRDGSKKAMGNEQILAFLRERAASAASLPDGSALVALWQENGANDQYIRILDIEDRIPGLDKEVVLYTIILPSGVRAGPEQKGNEPLKKKGEKR